MTDLNQIQDTLNIQDSDMKRMPQMLNVLTILTYVGCAFAAIGGIFSYFTSCKNVSKLSDVPELENESLNKMMSGVAEMAQKQCDYRLPVLLVTLLCAGLCFWGAMQMRNLKKTGFYVYTAGEILAPILMMVLLGASSMGGMMMAAGLIVPIVFVILYATQLKHLS